MLLNGMLRETLDFPSPMYASRGTTAEKSIPGFAVPDSVHQLKFVSPRKLPLRRTVTMANNSPAGTSTVSAAISTLEGPKGPADRAGVAGVGVAASAGADTGAAANLDAGAAASFGAEVDADVDAGAAASFDAGVDAGVAASFDMGVAASFDMGVDAGADVVFDVSAARAAVLRVDRLPSMRGIEFGWLITQ
jgi:hypothetical protein